jgi:hypothetical protein
VSLKAQRRSVAVEIHSFDCLRALKIVVNEIAVLGALGNNGSGLFNHVRGI